MAKAWTNKRAQIDVPLRMTLTENGRGFDLTGYTVKFRFADSDGAQIFERACTVESAATGIVRYDWQSGDLDDAGSYQGEFLATKTASSNTRIFPSSGNIPISIIDDLA